MSRPLAFVQAAVVGCWLLVLSRSTVAGTAAQDTTVKPPTPVEQALAEHVCGATQLVDPSDNTHEQCVSAQFRALRSEFGYDLSRLPAADRSRLDATCSPLRRPENLHPYFNCLTARLVALRARLPREASDPEQVAFGLTVATDRPSAPASSSHRLAIVIASLLCLTITAAGGATAAIRLKKKIGRHICQQCGAELQTTAALCAACRHDMGVADKRAIAERAAEKRADERRAEEERLRREHEENEERRLAEAQPVPQLQPPFEPGPVPSPTPLALASDDEDAVETDPFVILGIPRDATAEQIERAYKEGTSKYDEASVADFGHAVQAHYRAKFEAIEQAYKTITAGVDASATPIR